MITLSAAVLTVWIVEPFGNATAAALFSAGLFQTLRLARWAGDRTLRDRLIVVLHVAYAFLPLGYVLTGLSSIGVVVPSAGLHAWMVGAAGMMTVAVMTRATLGHTGHELTASALTQIIYAAVFIAAVARICAALEPRWSELELHVARSHGLQHFWVSALSMARGYGAFERRRVLGMSFRFAADFRRRPRIPPLNCGAHSSARSRLGHLSRCRCDATNQVPRSRPLMCTQRTSALGGQSGHRHVRSSDAIGGEADMPQTCQNRR